MVVRCYLPSHWTGYFIWPLIGALGAGWFYSHFEIQETRLKVDTNFESTMAVFTAQGTRFEGSDGQELCLAILNIAKHVGYEGDLPVCDYDGG